MNLKHIVGPPGTGKTSRLMEYLEILLKRGVPPNSIVFCSFTKAAVEEAKKRAAALLGYQAEDFALFGTIHSLAFRRLGLTRDNVFTGKRWRDFCKTANLAYTETSGWADDDPFEPIGNEEGDILRRFHDWHRNCMIDTEEGIRLFEVSADSPWDPVRARWFVRTVEEHKTGHALYDFPDMLLDIDKEEWVPPARVLLVDEAQDLAPLQQRIVMRWAEAIGNVLMAYDPDQAIYGFQGAAPEWLLGLGGQREFLTQSHRVPRLPASVCRRIIERNRVRYANTWEPKAERGEVRFDADLSVLVRRAAEDRSGWYFLARNRFYLGAMCDALKQHGVPYRNLRGPSPECSGAVLTALRLASGSSVSFEEVVRLADRTPQVGWWVRGSKSAMERAVTERGREQVGLADLGALGAEPALTDALASPKGCLKPLKLAEGNKDYFFRVWQRYGAAGLTDTPWVQVSTIHGVKGGERPNVVISPQMTRKTSEGYDADPEPERRVWYVGASRTSDRLFVLDPESTGATFSDW